MRAVLLFLLIAAGQAQLSVQVNRYMNLTNSLSEEIYLLRVVNKNDHSARRLRFRLNPRLFPSLKIARAYEDNQLRHMNTTFTSNELSIEFEKPRRADEIFFLKLSLLYLKPFEFVPGKVGIFEDQRVLYRDRLLNLEFEDGVEVEWLAGRYLVPRDIQRHTREAIEQEMMLSSSVKQLILREARGAAMTRDFEILYVDNVAFETLPLARKSVELSMWGSLAVSYELHHTNEAAPLEGELSNIDFQPHSQHAGRNAVRVQHLMLPAESWQISISDEVGNLTRPVAHRRGGEGIEVVLIPRFSLFGGWNSTYYLSYNQWSANQLGVHSKQPNVFRLEVDFQPPFRGVLAKRYSFRVCLPELAQLISVDAPADFPGFLGRIEEKNFGIFEAFGKNCYRFEYENIVDFVHNQRVAVYFRYSSALLWWKLLYLVAVVSALFMVVFALARVDFSFDAKSQDKVKKE